MQYVTTRPVLNVEECGRLSFMPYLFGTDFMLAELQVYALAKQWMPEQLHATGHCPHITLPSLKNPAGAGGFRTPVGRLLRIILSSGLLSSP